MLRRCYIYNKAYHEAYYNATHTADADKCVTNELQLVKGLTVIRDWADKRGIYDEW